MVKIAYLDCFSGISGDMLLGALLHAGLPQRLLDESMATLGIGVQFHCAPDQRFAISGSTVTVRVTESKTRRSWKDIQSLLRQSILDEPVRRNALKIFTILAEAEAKVHGCAPEKVHFHELGGADAIADIVGAVIGFAYFNIENLACSPLPLSSGWVECAHGKLPLPAPAVCEIVQDIPVQGSTLNQELVTPTGAAIVKGLVSRFGPMPPMLPKITGYGGGSQILSNGQPNLLRLIIGDEIRVQEEQEIEVITTNLDDWAAEGFGHLCDRLFDLGALDVTLQHQLMKKGRPGYAIEVLAAPATAHLIKECLLSETSAIGLRFHRAYRRTLSRKIGTIDSPWGDLEVKMVETPTGQRLYPEYESCRKIADKANIPLPELYRFVQAASTNQFKENQLT